MTYIRKLPPFRRMTGGLLLALGICLFTLTIVLLIPWPPHLVLGVMSVGAVGGSAAVGWAALDPTIHPLVRALTLGAATLIFLITLSLLALAALALK